MCVCMNVCTEAVTLAPCIPCAPLRGRKSQSHWRSEGVHTPRIPVHTLTPDLRGTLFSGGGSWERQASLTPHAAWLRGGPALAPHPDPAVHLLFQEQSGFSLPLSPCPRSEALFPGALPPQLEETVAHPAGRMAEQALQARSSLFRKQEQRAAYFPSHQSFPPLRELLHWRSGSPAHSAPALPRSPPGRSFVRRVGGGLCRGREQRMMWRALLVLFLKSQNGSFPFLPLPR